MAAERSRLRFGVVARTAESASAWRAKVQRFESLGFDVVFVPDHVGGHRLAPLIALAAAAEATTTLRLSTMVLGNDFRHPAILAKEAATLDVLSDGRLELGIGTGWMRDDYDRSGLTFDPPGLRVARLQETLQILRGAWSGQPFSFEGEHYRVDRLEVQPAPVQRHLPIHVGGGGPVMLRVAAQHADIVNVTNRTSADGRGVVAEDLGLTSLLAKLRLLQEAAGPRWDDLEVSVSVQAIAIDKPLEAVQARSAHLADSMDALRGTPFILHGSRATIAEDVLRWSDEHAIRFFVVHDEADAEDAASVIQTVRS